MVKDISDRWGYPMSNFKKLSDHITREYEKKGYTPEEARKIGDETAADIGRKKYGEPAMVTKAEKGEEK